MRRSLFGEMDRKRHEDVQMLLGKLGAIPPGTTTVEPAIDEYEFADAIMALGEIRATEAADPLAKRLDWLPRSALAAYDQDAPTVIRFPAASALIEIGRPAVPDLLRVIERSDSSEFERRLAALTLLRIEVVPSDDFETDDALTKERLMLLFEQRQRRTPPAVKDRYSHLIKWLKDYEEQHKDPRTIPGFLPDATTADAPSE